MSLVYLIKGVIIGLAGSIPLGPIGVMCIQRTLCNSRRSGFVSGLGSAVADAVFATIAFFSLSVVMSFIENNLLIVKVIGGISVLIVGMVIFLKNPVVQIRRSRAGKGNLWSDFLSLLLVTLANPAFILIFVALFAALGVSSTGIGYADGAVMILGVFCGASLWWFTLTFTVSLLRHRIRPRHLLWINRLSGALIVILGAAAILSIFLRVLNGIPALPA